MILRRAYDFNPRSEYATCVLVAGWARSVQGVHVGAYVFRMYLLTWRLYSLLWYHLGLSITMIAPFGIRILSLRGTVLVWLCCYRIWFSIGDPPRYFTGVLLHPWFAASPPALLPIILTLPGGLSMLRVLVAPGSFYLIGSWVSLHSLSARLARLSFVHHSHNYSSEAPIHTILHPLWRVLIPMHAAR